MTDVDKANIARLKHSGHNFEVLIDSNKAIEFKKNQELDFADVLAVEKIFSDAKKGMEASPALLKNCFDSEDVIDVAKQIVVKGNFHLTSEYKEKLREQKKRQIIDMIHRNAVDPKTHNPHPPARIELAIEQANVHFDEFSDVQTQMKVIVDKIRPILPIKFEIKEIAVKIPSQYAPKTHNILNNFGKKLKEEWLSDGSLSAVIEIPGGLEEDFYEKLNAICHGTVEAKVLNTK